MCAFPTVDRQCLTCGYLREFVNKCNIAQSYVVPAEICELIYHFYGESYIIYGVGRNFCGEFGVEHSLKVRQYTELQRFSALCDSPKYIYLQCRKFYIKTESNQIYFAGFDDITNEFCSKFQELLIYKEQNRNSNILLISEGLQANHTFFLLQNQNNNPNIKMYALGNNYRGQFGCGGRTRKYENIYIHDVTHNISAYVDYAIKKIKCGDSHTLFLTHNGLLYGCGCNRYSQCGHESIDNDVYYYPKLIPVQNALIMDICCGSNHNLCLSTDHKLYVFGSNAYGQIGPKRNDSYDMKDNDDTSALLLPSRNQIIQAKLHPHFVNVNIDSIGCGSDYSMVMDTKGNCWLFGDNRCGQIGVHRDRECVDEPFLIQTYDDLKDIKIEYGSCGFTHSVLCSTKEPQQNIYVFGCNLHSECSSLQKKMRFIDAPYLLTKNELFGERKQYKIKRVIAARCSTLIICQK